MCYLKLYSYTFFSYAYNKKGCGKEVLLVETFSNSETNIYF